VVLQLTVFWYIGAVLGHVCLGLGVLAYHVAQLGFLFPPMGPWSLCCSVVGWL
jgi:hypothetical protein